MLFIRSRKSLFILIISEKLKYGKISLHNTAKVNNFGACENRSNYAVGNSVPPSYTKADWWLERERRGNESTLMDIEVDNSQNLQ